MMKGYTPLRPASTTSVNLTPTVTAPLSWLLPGIDAAPPPPGDAAAVRRAGGGLLLLLGWAGLLSSALTAAGGGGRGLKSAGV